MFERPVLRKIELPVDEHPVEWLVGCLKKKDIMEPLLTWLTELDPEFPDPRTYNFPAPQIDGRL